MPLEIIRNDITKMQVDAIVNTANPFPEIGSGVDTAIHTAAGPRLLQARKKVGNIVRGNAAITPAFDLTAKYVIHTVGPIWEGGKAGEVECLRSCYQKSLELALENGCTSIAFPLLATGNYGFPKDKALQIAISAFSEFLLAHEMQIFLVVFNQDAYKLSEKLFSHVASYIDQNYVDACEMRNFERAEQINLNRLRRDKYSDLIFGKNDAPSEQSVAQMAPKALTLEELLKTEDIGFSEALLKLIDGTGKKDSEIYKKANISKQHFSKIRNNLDYKPTKSTAIALALALELRLEDTKDLIGRAGYALTNSSKFDLIVRFFIEQGNYNVVEINIALYEFDQSLLGN